MDDTEHAMLDQMTARLYWLERLVIDRVADEWTPERVAIWHDHLTRQNDASSETPVTGQSIHQVALDRLAERLLAASRHQHGR